MQFKFNFNEDSQIPSVKTEIQDSKQNSINLKNQQSKVITRSSTNPEGIKKKHSKYGEEIDKNKEKKSKKNQKSQKIHSSNSQSESYESITPDRFNDFQDQSRNFDIVMNGHLLYRFTQDQIELEGTWSMNNDMAKERFSYLFLRKIEKIGCSIRKEDIDFENQNEELSMQNNEFTLNICTSNIFELVAIPYQHIFKVLLQYLSGEYHGFFMYYEKTIEDRFQLNLMIEEDQVRITGEGSNNLGTFNLIGFINFYRNKDELIARNDMDSEVIHVGEFKMNKIYNAFNTNENFRVIKSFQHRKKRSEDDSN